MRTFQLSLLSLTLGLGLAACQEDPDIGAPGDTDTTETGDEDSGDGDGDASESDTEDSGDGDGDESESDTEESDTDESGDGDGDAEPAECGNGVLEAEEECDDGNGTDNDACSNACNLPVCGDGIMQAGEGELCDDGNDIGGDACTATCQIPGTEIWEKHADLFDGGDDVGYELALGSSGSMNILASSDGEQWLVKFDPDGGLLWSFPTPPATVPALAIGPEDQLAIGGQFNGSQGLTRLYDADGNAKWTRTVPGGDSDIYGVAIDDSGRVFSAGRYDGDRSMLRLLDGAGEEIWAKLELAGGGYGPLAVSGEGQSWAVRLAPLAVQKWTPSGSPEWTSEALPEGNYRDIVVDDLGMVYLLSEALDQSHVTLTKLDADGDLIWSVEHDEPEQMDFASGLALLPAGGVIMAGAITTEAGYVDGFLAWYDAEGKSLIPDLVLDNMHPAVDLDMFFDVQVGEDYGVAIGATDPEQGDAELWIYKFAI